MELDRVRGDARPSVEEVEKGDPGDGRKSWAHACRLSCARHLSAAHGRRARRASGCWRFRDHRPAPRIGDDDVKVLVILRPDQAGTGGRAGAFTDGISRSHLLFALSVARARLYAVGARELQPSVATIRALALSFALATASYYFVEQPFRSRRASKPRALPFAHGDPSAASALSQ